MLEESCLQESDSSKKVQGKNCFVCDKSAGVSPRKVNDLFSPIKVTGAEEFTPAAILGKILKKEIQPDNVHSKLICKKCSKVCSDYQDLSKQLNQIVTEIENNYDATSRKYPSAEIKLKPDAIQILEQNINTSQGRITNQRSSMKNTNPKISVESDMADNSDTDNIIINEGADSYISTKQCTITEQYFDDNDVNMVEIISEDYGYVEVHEEHGDEDEDQDIHDEHQGEDLDQDHEIQDNDDDIIEDEEDEEDIEEEENNFKEKMSKHGEVSTNILIAAAENSLAKQIEIKTEPSDDNISYKPLIKKENVTLYKKEGENYYCELCPQDEHTVLIIYDGKSIVLHMKIQHDEKIFVCEECGEYFRKRTALNIHADEHSTNVQDGEYQCDICERGFNNYRQYRIHKRNHTPSARTWSCEHCNKKYGSKNLLDEHLNMHTGARPYKCSECSKDFASKYTLSSHLKIHAKRDRSFNCKFCNKSFYSNQNLVQHEKIHTGLREFICPDCGKAFISQHNLDVHKIVHTGYKPFICRICGKAFARRAEIKDHERTHTGERPYSCDICGTSFAQRSNLQSHKRATHLNDKRHKCEECDRSFKRRRLLDYHIKATHTGERPFKCKDCDSSFVYPEHYKKHIKIHTGIKPYKCEVCSRSFHSRDNRNAHRFVHSDKKPYECVICGKGFMRKPQLYTHMQQQGHLNDTIIINQPHINENDEGYQIHKEEVKATPDLNNEELTYVEEEIPEDEDIVEEHLVDENEEELIYDGQVQFSGEHITNEEFSNDEMLEQNDLNDVITTENMLITEDSHLIENEDGTVQLVQIHLPSGSDGKDKMTWVNLVSQ